MWVARGAPLIYRLAQVALWVLFRIFTRIRVTGREHIPLAGPLIMAPNHLHAFDIPIMGMIVPRQTVVFAAEKWRGKAGGLLMQLVTRVIYVSRGEVDRGAMNQALEVLHAGGCVAVAPEGTRSRTGGLQQGKHGAAYLASRTGATVVPVIMWGQENTLSELPRLRRAAICVSICPPVQPPAGGERARTAELEAYTDHLMMILARGLPPGYRGVYAERVLQEGEAGRGRGAPGDPGA